MLLCCLRLNVEASCHKHFVVVSCEKQMPPLTSDYYQLVTIRRSWVYCTWQSNRSQHAMEHWSQILLGIAIFACPTCIQRPR